MEHLKFTSIEYDNDDNGSQWYSIGYAKVYFGHSERDQENAMEIAERIKSTWNEHDDLLKRNKELLEIKNLAEKLIANRKRDNLHPVDFQRIEQAINNNKS